MLGETEFREIGYTPITAVRRGPSWTGGLGDGGAPRSDVARVAAGDRTSAASAAFPAEALIQSKKSSVARDGSVRAATPKLVSAMPDDSSTNGKTRTLVDEIADEEIDAERATPPPATAARIITP